MGLVPLPVQEQAAAFDRELALRGTTWFDEEQEIFALERAREAAAKLLNARSEAIAIATSMTEALCQVAWWLRPGAGTNVVSIDLEFPSVVYPWYRVATETEAEVRLVQVRGRSRLALPGETGGAGRRRHRGHLRQPRPVRHWFSLRPRRSGQTGACAQRVVDRQRHAIRRHGPHRPANERGRRPARRRVQVARRHLRRGHLLFGSGDSGRDRPAIRRLAEHDRSLCARRHQHAAGLLGQAPRVLDDELRQRASPSARPSNTSSIWASSASWPTTWAWQRACWRGSIAWARTILTPRDDRSRAGIVTARFPGHDSEAVAARLNAAGVIVSPRFGSTRFSTHVFNHAGDVDQALNVLEDILAGSRAMKDPVRMPHRRGRITLRNEGSRHIGANGSLEPRCFAGTQHDTCERERE